MPVEQAAGEFALQCSEAEVVVGVALENKLHHAIAESADSVVEDDRVGGVSWHGKDSNVNRRGQMDRVQAGLYGFDLR